MMNKIVQKIFWIVLIVGICMAAYARMTALQKEINSKSRQEAVRDSIQFVAMCGLMKQVDRVDSTVMAWIDESKKRRMKSDSEEAVYLERERVWKKNHASRDSVWKKYLETGKVNGL